MASVWKAYQPSLDRTVALKLLPPHLANQPGFPERFRREARAIAKLAHPHILAIYDFGQDGDLAYLAMPYVEAGTLQDLLRKGRIPLDEAARIVDQIAGALDHAHGRGVVHRDVKPSNVLLDSSGRTYLSDFGVAKILEGDSLLTGTGVGIGTPVYMSPEQGLGKPADGRSDIYSLGIMLFEMLTGQVPFRADTPMAVVHKHIHEPFPLPRKLNPELSESVEQVILKAVAKAPADRFRSAGEMAAALHRAAEASKTIRLGREDRWTGKKTERTTTSGPAKSRVWWMMAAASLGILLVLAVATVLGAFALFPNFLPGPHEEVAVPSQAGPSADAVNGILGTWEGVVSGGGEGGATRYTRRVAIVDDCVSHGLNDSPCLRVDWWETGESAYYAFMGSEGGALCFWQRLTPPGATGTFAYKFCFTPGNGVLEYRSEGNLWEESGTLVQVVEGETLSSTPMAQAATPVPEGSAQGQIVFTCQVLREEALNQVCIVNADGSGYRRLTSDDRADHFYPALAPDGESVVLSSNQSGEYAIYEMDLGGGGMRQLTNLGDDYAPAVSPNGDQVVFTHNDGNSQTLWIVNQSGEGLRQITDARDGESWDPVWSPDGLKILFASNRAGGVQLFTMDAGGGNVRQVTQIQGIRGRSDWASTGAFLTTYVGSPWNWEIVLIDWRGTILDQVTDGGNNLAPSVSPDGEWIAFTSYRDHPGDDNGCEIYVMRKDGSEVTRLTSNDYCDWQPRWGP